MTGEVGRPGKGHLWLLSEGAWVRTRVCSQNVASSLQRGPESSFNAAANGLIFELETSLQHIALGQSLLSEGRIDTGIQHRTPASPACRYLERPGRGDHFALVIAFLIN